MPIDTFLIYAAAVFVLTVTPGPSVLMAVSTSVNHGFRQAVLASLGSTSAITGIMLLSTIGLGTVLAASEFFFSLLKYFGAAYLLYLGITSLLAARTTSLLSLPDQQARPNSFLKGFLIGASNPKALLFFAALFPQFIDPASPRLPQFVVMCLTFVAFELFWLTTYAALGARASSWLQAPGRATFFNRLTGSVFIVAAGALASVKRNPV